MTSFYLQELEDTIKSLRQQVSVLQSRIQMLQEDVDSSNKMSGSFELGKENDYSWSKSWHLETNINRS